MLTEELPSLARLFPDQNPGGPRPCPACGIDVNLWALLQEGRVDDNGDLLEVVAHVLPCGCRLPAETWYLHVGARRWKLCRRWWPRRQDR